MPVQFGKKTFLGFIGGLLMALKTKGLKNPDLNTLKKADFKTSTQGMGVRFTEKIRDIFRKKWIKKT